MSNLVLKDFLYCKILWTFRFYRDKQGEIRLVYCTKLGTLKQDNALNCSNFGAPLYGAALRTSLTGTGRELGIVEKCITIEEAVAWGFS
jgi:hypothetical protein